MFQDVYKRNVFVCMFVFCEKAQQNVYGRPMYCKSIVTIYYVLTGASKPGGPGALPLPTFLPSNVFLSHYMQGLLSVKIVPPHFE